MHPAAIVIKRSAGREVSAGTLALYVQRLTAFLATIVQEIVPMHATETGIRSNKQLHAIATVHSVLVHVKTPWHRGKFVYS